MVLHSMQNYSPFSLTFSYMKSNFSLWLKETSASTKLSLCYVKTLFIVSEEFFWFFLILKSFDVFNLRLHFFQITFGHYLYPFEGMKIILTEIKRTLQLFTLRHTLEHCKFILFPRTKWSVLWTLSQRHLLQESFFTDVFLDELKKGKLKKAGSFKDCSNSLDT